jgi:non-specific serine/threonine protein kinase
MGMRPFVAQLQDEWAAERERRARPGDAPPLRELRMVQEGDVWLVEGEGERCRVKDSRGLRMLASLLAQPDHELHCLELGGGAGARAIDAVDAGPALDLRARGEYRARLRALRGEIDEAEAWNDLARAQRAREEAEQLEHQLAAALGLGGRDRRQLSASERARSNVQRRLKLAIAHIEARAPALGRRLAESVRTGTFCCFEPDRRRRR